MEKAKLGFIYTVEHIGVDGKVKSRETVKNIIPDLGLDYLLGVAFKGVSQYSSWYLTLYDANRTPLSTDTMVTFMADCSENTGYTAPSGERQLIVFPAIVNGVLDTEASPNEFEFLAAATVRGAFITTNITRGSDSGLLISAVLFPSTKTLSAGESLRVPCGFAFLST